MIQRNITPALQAALTDMPIVLLTGARQTGKRQYEQDDLRLGDVAVGKEIASFLMFLATRHNSCLKCHLQFFFIIA